MIFDASASVTGPLTGVFSSLKPPAVSAVAECYLEVDGSGLALATAQSSPLSLIEFEPIHIEADSVRDCLKGVQNLPVEISAISREGSSPKAPAPGFYWG